MTELLFKLIDRFIELAKRREQQRVDLFKHFVEPAWKDFEAVHDNYLATFRKYLDLVSDSTRVLDDHHAVFRMLEADSLFSEAMRSRLAEARRLSIEDEMVQAFVQSIISYLCSVPENSILHAATPEVVIANCDSAAMDEAMLMMMCLPRVSLKHELRHAAQCKVTSDESRELARLCILVATEELQAAYRSVLDCFVALKADLLKHATR